MEEHEAAIAQAPCAGVATSMVQRGSAAPAAAEGMFAAQRGFQVVVAITGECPFAADDDVLLACGEVGERVAALARFQSFADGAARFMRLSAWRPVNTRAFPRYRTSMRATVRRSAGNLRGTVIDISRGGLALCAEELPGIADFDVRVGTQRGVPFLPCRLVYQRDTTDGRLLHVRFRELGSTEAEYVERLIRELCAAIEPALLAG